MIIAVDIGGTSSRVASYQNGRMSNIRRFYPHSVEELIYNIQAVSNGGKVHNIGISIAGFVDYNKNQVTKSNSAGWATGDLAGRLKNTFSGANVMIMNDGEAHALAMLSDKNITEYGGICLSLGTSVGFGVIGTDRKPVRTLTGDNWDIGEWLIRTRYQPANGGAAPGIWWLLGSYGFNELKDSHGDKAYSHYGYRLGSFLSQLTMVFHPKTIALTGGITNDTHWSDIENTMMTEIKADLHRDLKMPKIVKMRESETALIGVVNYFNYINRRSFIPKL